MDENTGLPPDVQTPASTAPETGSADYWSQRQANLLRGQWDYWQQQFAPVETYFTGLVTDPQQRQALRAESMGYVEQASKDGLQRGLQSLATRDQRYGVGLDALEQGSRERKMGATAAATKAKGLTDMSSYLDEREQQMMSGGVAYARTS